MFSSRKFHFARQKVNFFKAKFKISALCVSVVKFLIFSVESSLITVFSPMLQKSLVPLHHAQ